MSEESTALMAMVETENHSTENQSIDLVPLSSHGNDKKEVLPEIRKPKTVWKIVCCLISLGMLVYCAVKYKSVEYNPVKDCCNKNSTGVCYEGKQKDNFEKLINLGLALFGVFLARLFDCLFNVFEELRQFKSRYNRNMCKVLKKCFSGKEIKVISGVALLVGVPSIAGRLVASSFSLDDGMLIAGSFGVGRFFVWLLFDVKAFTGADRSRDREKSGQHPIEGVAWSFCVNHFSKVLPIFKTRFTENTMPVQDQEQIESNAESEIPIHRKEMFIIFSHKYEEHTNLEDWDNHIKKVTSDETVPGYEFTVYSLKLGEKRAVRYVIQFAEGPLKILKEMYKGKRKDELKEQVKLLYRKVTNVIREHYWNHENSITPVLITEDEDLKDGRLVKQIMSYVPSDQWPRTDDVPEENHPALPAHGHAIDMTGNGNEVDFVNEGDNERRPLLAEEEQDSPKRGKALTRKHRGASKSKQSEQQSVALKHSAMTTDVLNVPDESVRRNNEEQNFSLSSEQTEKNDREGTRPSISGQQNESVDSLKHGGVKKVKPTYQPAIFPTRHQGPAIDDQELKMKKSCGKRKAKDNSEDQTSLPLNSYEMKPMKPDISGKLPAQTSDTKDDGISCEENSDVVSSTSGNQSLSGHDYFKDWTNDLDGVEREQRPDKDDKETRSSSAKERRQHTSSGLVAEGKSHGNSVESEERVDVGDDEATTMHKDVEESKEDECQEKTGGQRMPVIQFVERVEKLAKEDVVEL